jgi:hypothetical protein
MKCIPREEGKDILEEIHKGVCGNHMSSRTLVNKAFRRAFYWPTALGETTCRFSRPTTSITTSRTETTRLTTSKTSLPRILGGG